MERFIKVGLKTYKEKKLLGKKGYLYKCVALDHDKPWPRAIGYQFVRKHPIQSTPFTPVTEIQWQKAA